MKTISILLLLFLQTGHAQWTTKNSLNGRMWDTFSRKEKAIYLRGIMDGIVLLNNVSIAQGIDVHNISVNLTSPTETPTSELVAQIDDFYGDLANRNIQLEQAYRYVISRILGFSERALQSFLEKLRQEASDE